MPKVIHCPCGTVIRANDESELISRAQEHARVDHGLELSREQARAMARPE
jgi:predicted small metal-binding protein